MTKNKLNTLERIRAIIEADIETAEAGEEGLATSVAKKLVDYAKLEIALQRHDADLADAEEDQKLAKEQYEKLLEQVKGLALGQPEETDELEDDDQ